ncbi:MAG TPA: class I SAM-dependent methyltransferase [Ktedonobacterales bacterium]|nr:class I SAM-dependent methyltransferase [Ktedonobacterales bacterium]
MASHSGRMGPLGASGNWDDWDPDDAHGGYTGKVGALNGLDPAAETDTPAAAELSSTARAALARMQAADYLTATFAPDDPGFVELYDTLIVPQWSRPFGQLLLSVLLTQPRGNAWQVLDVACGTGYPTIELARYLGQDCDLAGLDTWEAAIQRARQKASDEWLRNVSFVVADVCASGLPDGTIDTITCNLGLASFADPRAALGAMARLLHPGGSLLLTSPLQSALREFLDIYYLTLRDLKLTDYKHNLARLIATRPTAAQLRALLESTGFEVERTVNESFTLRFAGPRAFLTSPIIHTSFMPAWRDVVPDLTVRRLVFNEVERRLRARAEANGGALALTVPMVCLLARRL